MYEIQVRRFFSSSHCLRGDVGKCEALHGHNWEIVASIECEELNEMGIAIDFRDIKKYMDEILDGLDHIHLNEHPAFSTAKDNPSAENIARYIFEVLSEKIKQANARVSKITVYESRDCAATYKKD